MNEEIKSYERYSISLARTAKPVQSSQLPQIKMDLAGLFHYAQKKNTSLNELSDDEIEMFCGRRESRME